MSAYFAAIIIEAVLVGVGWGMGVNSCQFVYVATITATVMLALLLAGLLFFGLGLFTAPFLLWACSLLNLAYFIWGIVVLAEHTCEGVQPIIMDVFSGLGAFLFGFPL